MRNDKGPALAGHVHDQAIDYDERLPIPPELLAGVSASGWFPVAKDMDGITMIATKNPDSAALRADVAQYFDLNKVTFRQAQPDAIQWYIQDFLNAPPGELIGTERTGLAYWRNTMAHWRTRLACYRNDLARARTALAFIRGGLTLTTIADAMFRSGHLRIPAALLAVMLAAGLGLISCGVPVYLQVRKSRLTPPRDQTLVEVTAATLVFLEEYHFPEALTGPHHFKETMLARLGDFLADYCTILSPSPPSRVRTHLARERNVLAAQRTIAACYRTIYSRARTGLAFVRTGISCVGVGIGLFSYFGMGADTMFDALLVAIGSLMIIDGVLWYLPVRKEQAELPKSRSSLLADL